MSHPILRAVLFDHDGTLVDTEPLWEEAKVELSARYDAVWTQQDTLDCLGRPMSETIDRLQGIGVDLPWDELLERLSSAAQDVVARTRIEFLPGIAPLLQELAEAEVPAAIVTNATAEIASVTAGRAPAGLIRTVIGNEDVSRPKPDPQPYLMAAQRLGVEPQCCVAVEDSPAGAASATAAGMKVVVVPGMLEVPAELGDLRSPHAELTLEAIRSLFPVREETVPAGL